MNGNCDLELRLDLPPFPDTDRHPHHPSTTHYSPSIVDDGSLKQREHQQEKKKLTLLYNGNISVSDVTELQARAILILATREMDMARVSQRTEPSSQTELEAHPNQWCNPSTGLKMRISLQRFLQKRRSRVQEASPY